MEEIYKRYIEEICTTCKAEECTKGICRLISDIVEVKCVDYIKDETKIKPIERELKVTARKNKSFESLYQ